MGDTGFSQLRVCSFKGLQNLPVYVAARRSFFAALRLDVTINYTSGSAQQVAGLVRREYELIQTAPDNVIHADIDPATFGLDPANAPRIVMLCGGSVGPLSMYAQPHITTLASLRDSVIGVDNPGSGFAIVLRDLLARGGLILGRDYTLAVAGGTSARLDVLKARAVAATILYPPYDTLADAAGYRRLATSTEVYPAYASLATAGMRSWAEEHSSEVTRYIAAVLAALRWIYDPTNAEHVLTILRDEPALRLDAVTAARAYSAFVAPDTGFGAEARMDPAGLAQVITLRNAYGTPGHPTGQPMDYYDARWYDRARAGAE